MPTAFYLDTARFGRMVPRARGALGDFVRLCGEEGGSGRVLAIVRDGAGPPGGRYPGLDDWAGLARFQRSLRALAGAGPDCEVRIAGRSAPLMRVAVRGLFRRCDRVLHTDLEWPPHLALLGSEAGRVRRRAVPVPVKDEVFRGGLTESGLVGLLADAYRSLGCDGLFLSDVSYEGVRLPISGLLEELRFARRRPFVVIDGAQALGHLPARLEAGGCDLYLAGCHKWLGAGQPLSLGFCPRASSRGLLADILEELIDSGEVDDPLLLMDREISAGEDRPFGGTVDLSCLFSAAAAVAAARSEPTGAGGLGRRVANAGLLASAARGSGWRPLAVDPPLRTGILLLEAEAEGVKSAPPGRIRAGFERSGVALTAYAGGIVRLSLPGEAWGEADVGRLRSALGRSS